MCREEGGGWVEEQKLDAHHDWVRDVAWAPSVGLQRSIIASCSQVSHLSPLHHHQHQCNAVNFISTVYCCSADKEQTDKAYFLLIYIERKGRVFI